MVITPEHIAAAEALYGRPCALTTQHEISPRELGPIRRSERKRRHHDVTVYIFASDDLEHGLPLSTARLAVIAKESYPPGAYRPPGGGVHRGETMAEGAQREAYEETGLPVLVVRYLVRASVRFTCGSELADWTTHVFAAVTLHAPAPVRLQTHDQQEIRAACWSSVAEVQGSIRALLLATGRGLFAYRVALHDAVAAATTDLRITAHDLLAGRADARQDQHKELL